MSFNLFETIGNAVANLQTTKVQEVLDFVYDKSVEAKEALTPSYDLIYDKVVEVKESIVDSYYTGYNSVVKTTEEEVNPIMCGVDESTVKAFFNAYLKNRDIDATKASFISLGLLSTAQAEFIAAAVAADVAKYGNILDPLTDEKPVKTEAPKEGCVSLEEELESALAEAKEYDSKRLKF
jgi:hypothetical protein